MDKLLSHFHGVTQYMKSFNTTFYFVKQLFSELNILYLLLYGLSASKSVVFSIHTYMVDTVMVVDLSSTAYDCKFIFWVEL